jgi:hypothetical protein
MAALIREVLHKVLDERQGLPVAPPTPSANPGDDELRERMREMARNAIDPQLGARKRAGGRARITSTRGER